VLAFAFCKTVLCMMRMRTSCAIAVAVCLLVAGCLRSTRIDVGSDSRAHAHAALAAKVLAKRRVSTTVVELPVLPASTAVAPPPIRIVRVDVAADPQRARAVGPAVGSRAPPAG